MVTFWLGSHHPDWLGRTDVPLCVSLRRLRRQKRWPRALGPVLLDGGGFTELSQHGGWSVSAPTYAREIEGMYAMLGRVAYAAIQDWMCEPPILERTGLSVAEHQARTVDSYGELRTLAPGVPWLPVLQGWERGDYLNHLDRYAAAGFDLTRVPLVGVGTLCRRQHTEPAAAVVRTLAREGVTLHGFGLKLQGLTRVAPILASADSMAWSYHARREGYAWCGATTHKNCANCLAFALHWRERVLDLLASSAEQERQGGESQPGGDQVEPADPGAQVG